jgi:hypothetical protein
MSNLTNEIVSRLSALMSNAKYSIVGQKFQGHDPYLEGTEVGTEVILAHQPDNPMDSNAVMIWIKGEHVGYLRKEDARIISVLIVSLGEDWTPFPNHPIGIAADGSIVNQHPVRKSIKGVFRRSPNSAYPQVEIKEFKEI